MSSSTIVHQDLNQGFPEEDSVEISIRFNVNDDNISDSMEQFRTSLNCLNVRNLLELPGTVSWSRVRSSSTMTMLIRKDTNMAFEHNI